MHAMDVFQNLRESLAALDRATDWLERSIEQCHAIDLQAVLQPDECDALEALTSRYARVSDMLVQKVYRAIDSVELEEGGSPLDVLNRAHKRDLIESVDDMREIREVRNEVAHEYAVEDLTGLFTDVLRLAPQLLTLRDRVMQYCDKYHCPQP